MFAIFLQPPRKIEEVVKNKHGVKSELNLSVKHYCQVGTQCLHTVDVCRNSLSRAFARRLKDPDTTVRYMEKCAAVLWDRYL